jgi:hypothetical protein
MMCELYVMNHAIAVVKIFRGGAVAIFGVLVGVWL